MVAIRNAKIKCECGSVHDCVHASVSCLCARVSVPRRCCMREDKMLSTLELICVWSVVVLSDAAPDLIGDHDTDQVCEWVTERKRASTWM